MTLTDFLLARIAEDEAVARGLIDEDTWPHARDLSGPTRDDEYSGLNIGAGRVLAECEAKRRIVERHTAPLRILAAVYADHEDFRDEWKP